MSDKDSQIQSNCSLYHPSRLNIVRRDDMLYVFDPLRKKRVILTPEEFVRQNFVLSLINDLGYPRSLLANEVCINLNGAKKRCDTILFRPDGNPLMIMEYKAEDVKITQSVFDQILRYNYKLKADYLIVSNGKEHFCCKINYNDATYEFLPELPHYTDIKGTDK